MKGKIPETSLHDLMNRETQTEWSHLGIEETGEMNKAKLVEVVGRVVSTRKEALSAVDAMLNAVQHALRSGEKVVLAGVGSFHVKMRKAKIGRNPKTGVKRCPSRRAGLSASKCPKTYSRVAVARATIKLE